MPLKTTLMILFKCEYTIDTFRSRGTINLFVVLHKIIKIGGLVLKHILVVFNIGYKEDLEERFKDGEGLEKRLKFAKR